MGAYNKKKITQKEVPPKRSIVSQDPNGYYDSHPKWRFNLCDSEMWSLKSSLRDGTLSIDFFSFLGDFESRKWSEILIASKKQNHSINAKDLNPKAIKRLEEKYIEANSIISLRLNGTHRIYGYMIKNIFYILWYDSNHGDNPHCVCRSFKKHT